MYSQVGLVPVYPRRLVRAEEPLKGLEQLLDVGEVQAGRRLVEDVQRLSRRDLAELGGELDALRLTAGERRRRLAELDVVEPDVVKCLQTPPDLRDLGEELKRLLERHAEH